MDNNELHLSIENFDGPLDVLLTLVKEHKMDIFDINLVELTNDYLRIIEKLKNNNIDLASEYLVMAAVLIQLKARQILKDPEDEEVEDEKQHLLQQLVEYQQFKNISKELRVKELARKEIYIKEPEDYSQYAAAIDETRLDGNSDAVKLIIALRKMFERNHFKKLQETTIEIFKMTPVERRKEILLIFKNKLNPTFADIFAVPTLNHFVLTILTILDMARRQEIILEQKGQYDEIMFKRGELLNV